MLYRLALPITPTQSGRPSGVSVSAASPMRSPATAVASSQNNRPSAASVARPNPSPSPYPSPSPKNNLNYNNPQVNTFESRSSVSIDTGLSNMTGSLDTLSDLSELTKMVDNDFLEEIQSSLLTDPSSTTEKKTPTPPADPIVLPSPKPRLTFGDDLNIDLSELTKELETGFLPHEGFVRSLVFVFYDICIFNIWHLMALYDSNWDLRERTTSLWMRCSSRLVSSCRRFRLLPLRNRLRVVLRCLVRQLAQPSERRLNSAHNKFPRLPLVLRMQVATCPKVSLSISSLCPRFHSTSISILMAQ